MRIHALHSWDVTTSEAASIQRDLSTSVERSRPFSGAPRLIAGVDLSVDRVRKQGRGAVVVLQYDDLSPIEVRTIDTDVRWPYVPGLLSFREAPIVLDLCAALKNTPDVVLVDGHGIAHPRGLGLASHVGLFLDCTTVGCAKSLLCGEHAPLAEERGSTADIVLDGRVVGVALRTRHGVKPVYVSIGHKADLASAAGWVLHCASRYRLPEPTRLAHLAASGRFPAS
ncbi:MAG: deoxyribonuclease V [Chloroflexota bacterium]